MGGKNINNIITNIFLTLILYESIILISKKLRLKTPKTD
jgi:hypothetical protein